LRATIQTPIAIFSIGMKDFPFGTGASLAQHTRANAFLTVVPYGPFRFLHGWWLSTPVVAPLTSFNSVPDSYTKPSFFQGALVTYNAANVEIGGGAIIRMLHRGTVAPGAVRPVTVGDTANTAFGSVWNLANPTAGNGFDNDFQQYLAYMKYFNGRFFFNAEYQWTNNNVHTLYNPGQATLTTGTLNPAAPLTVYTVANTPEQAVPVYSETWLGFAELGCICGPGKLSLAFGAASGQVANAPRNDVGIQTKRYGNQNMNYQVLEPYNLLMFNTYGGGNQRFNADGTGEMEDAFTYAGRLDYAIASNLNFFGTFMWAHRWEKNGWFKGGVTNTGAPIAPTYNFLDGFGGNLANLNAFQALNFAGGLGTSINPFVDDGHIGWEANLGVDWKLLEGLTMNVRYAYWQPGKWFDQAYQASVPFGGAVINNGVLFGRDPINAVTGSLMINF
jgi:hypothetical protein